MQTFWIIFRKIIQKFGLVQKNKDFCGMSVAVRFLFFGIRFCRRNTEPLPKECLKTSYFRNEDNFFGNQVNLLGLNLKKSAFLVIWSSFGIPSVVSRSSLGKTRQGIREVKEKAILIKSTFLLKSNDRFGITRHGVWSFVQFFQKKCKLVP